MVGDNNKNMLSNNDKCCDRKKTKVYKEKKEIDKGWGNIAVLLGWDVEGMSLMGCYLN